MTPEREVCIVAAIKTVEGIVVRGQRHCDCFQAAARIKVVDEARLRDCVQGFVTSRNRFVTRQEGRQLQDAAGIRVFSAGDTLTSEDLY